ncbi:hypothetical protein GCM10025875_27530 [Litorihabitans aurantiacus]|uniref:Uncharacterized protein n=1 Tax=Litorihabitans aurantiacus TaxID=1930061 RepID=A0AA37XGD4_9MICO|nr:hypothetical protein GCM10025875_27530 [Litorihabitans aurantiacus]
MRRPDDHADDVRHHEPHERDDPGEGDGRAGGDGDQHDHADPQALDVEPDVPRGALAEREEVELPRHERRADDADHDQRCGDGDLHPARPVQRAELPEHDLLARLGVPQEGHERDDGTGDGVDRHPGQHQGDHLGAPVLPCGGVGEDRREQAPEERRERDAPLAHRRPAEHDHEARARGGARGDADDAGLGQRVAEDALHQHAADGEAGPDEHRERHAREPDGPQRALAVGVRHGHTGLDADAAQDRGDHLERRDAQLADAGRDDHEHDERDGEAEEQEGDAAGGHAGGEVGPPTGEVEHEGEPTLGKAPLIAV